MHSTSSVSIAAVIDAGSGSGGSIVPVLMKRNVPNGQRIGILDIHSQCILNGVNFATRSARLAALIAEEPAQKSKFD